MALPARLRSTWRKRAAIADRFRRQPLVDIGRDLEPARLRPRRQQFGDVLDQRGKREGPVLEVDPAGLDLGEVEQLLDQRQQRVAGGLHRLDVGGLLGGERRVEQEPAHADDAVERGADLVRRHGEEARLGAVAEFGEVARLPPAPARLGAVGDVAADALQVGGPAGVAAHEALAPGDPARAPRAVDLLVVDAGAVRLDRGVTLLQHRQREARADQRVARPAGERTIGVVDRGDDAVAVAQHDQVALGFEQAAGALLGLLKLPVAVGQRLVMQREAAHAPAHPAQPHAERREREARQREQEADAEREDVRVVVRGLAAAALDEAVGAGEGGGEDRQGAQRGADPRIAAGEAAKPQSDTQGPPHGFPLRWLDHVRILLREPA